MREGRAQQGPGWSPSFAVNQRAQSGLALVHILAALGYDWGLQLLIPLGALLNLQVAPTSLALSSILFSPSWDHFRGACPDAQANLVRHQNMWTTTACSVHEGTNNFIKTSVLGSQDLLMQYFRRRSLWGAILKGLLRCQDAWGRTALHWAAAYACEATVVLLLVRGAQPSPLSHGGETLPRVFPADMAAGNGHAGIAAFLSEQALLHLAKDKNVALDDSADARESPDLAGRMAFAVLARARWSWVGRAGS